MHTLFPNQVSLSLSLALSLSFFLLSLSFSLSLSLSFFSLSLARALSLALSLLRWCYLTGRCAYLPSVTCYRRSIKPPSPPPLSLSLPVSWK